MVIVGALHIDSIHSFFIGFYGQNCSRLKDQNPGGLIKSTGHEYNSEKRDSALVAFTTNSKSDLAKALGKKLMTYLDMDVEKIP